MAKAASRRPPTTAWIHPLIHGGILQQARKGVASLTGSPCAEKGGVYGSNAKLTNDLFCMDMNF